MIRRLLFTAPLLALLASAEPASAQTIGTFRWQLAPFGSVLNLTVVQQGGIYLLNGFEAQCGGNLSLPVSGVAVPQADGRIFLGVTSINVDGRGLHTRALINLSDFNGFWSDNAGNSSQAFVFDPAAPCPGGPRTAPVEPDEDAIAALRAELETLRARVAAAEAKKP